jgi:hypothetical protein
MLYAWPWQVQVDTLGHYTALETMTKNWNVLTLVGLQNHIFSTEWTEFSPLLLHFHGTAATENVATFHAYRPPLHLWADWTRIIVHLRHNFGEVCGHLGTYCLGHSFRHYRIWCYDLRKRSPHAKMSPFVKFCATVSKVRSHVWKTWAYFSKS